MSKLDELQRCLTAFVDDFEAVFDNDWEYTLEWIKSGDAIAPHRTFIQPLPPGDDESENWHNRGALLTSYRDLVELMKQLGIPTQIYWSESSDD